MFIFLYLFTDKNSCILYKTFHALVSTSKIKKKKPEKVPVLVLKLMKLCTFVKSPERNSFGHNCMRFLIIVKFCEQHSSEKYLYSQ